MNGMSEWRKAQNLRDLGELTARWLAGDLRAHPVHAGDGPDKETKRIVVPLVAANRAGFVTDCSQPQFDGPGPTGHTLQRAAVSGFADDATRLRLHGMVEGTDLMVIEHGSAPSHEQSSGEVVTLADGHPVDWFGRPVTEEDLSVYELDCSVAAATALRQAWQITVIDPQWDRRDYLWEAMLAEFRDTAGP